jgi:hypothetical protein
MTAQYCNPPGRFRAIHGYQHQIAEPENPGDYCRQRKPSEGPKGGYAKIVQVGGEPTDALTFDRQHVHDQGSILAFCDWMNLRDGEISGDLNRPWAAKSLNNGLRVPSPKISTLRITVLRREGSGYNFKVSRHDRPSTAGAFCKDPFQ